VAGFGQQRIVGWQIRSKGLLVGRFDLTKIYRKVTCSTTIAETYIICILL
jgi:hypothetical protein